MAISSDRKYTKETVSRLLDGIIGKTLGEIDSSNQFERTNKSPKITGIAGDVVEQSIFEFKRDNKQECDIEIDGLLTELKTTGVRIPKSDLKKAKGKIGYEYNLLLGAKEGITITGVTFEPTIQIDFLTSHFWKKASRLLLIFYEYKSYEIVSASEYSKFPIVDYCYNQFSDIEQQQLRNDWEIVRDYLQNIYNEYAEPDERNEKLDGFTHSLRSELLLIELVPGFKKSPRRRPRYRLKSSFVNHIIRRHFDKSRSLTEMKLKNPFTSFSDLDARCHALSLKYQGVTFLQFKEIFNIEANVSDKGFSEKCVLAMFQAECKKLNNISDFTKAGVIAKTITVTPAGHRTEDMKLNLVDFNEWSKSDIVFEDSDLYSYFCEHSFLCPMFCENVKNNPNQTTFKGFKRFGFDDDFIYNEVKRVWVDSRNLIFNKTLVWEYRYDKDGQKRQNKSGSLMGAPNFPKSKQYKVFFRGGQSNSSDACKTENVNGIKMLPQFIWLKGSYVVDKLKDIPFL